MSRISEHQNQNLDVSNHFCDALLTSKTSTARMSICAVSSDLVRYELKTGIEL